MQTEDSGIQKAHIFTHVFYDGTIISTNKVDYRDRLESENLDAVIVGAMQDSHKSMIRQLRSGSFDERIVKYIGAHPEASNKPEVAAPVVQEKAPAKRPDRRPPPEPREVVPQGPPLAAGEPGPTLDPTLGHVVFTAPRRRPRWPPRPRVRVRRVRAAGRAASDGARSAASADRASPRARPSPSGATSSSASLPASTSTSSTTRSSPCSPRTDSLLHPRREPPWVSPRQSLNSRRRSSSAPTSCCT
ncbi:hypothetical protein [Nannocystis pusilla]|uniref:hypothetical protein n=1 Tax=Nannocystis pusilla TaxID=889268 RepID=UPI003B7AFF60